MRLEALLPRQSSNCVSCPTDTPVCSCSSDQECVLINRSCTQCSYFQCQSQASTTGTTSSGGVSKGALAGAIVGVLIFLAVAIALFVWYRRSPRFRSKAATVPEAKADVPASAADVLNRPDPVEKHSSTVPSATEMNTVRVYSTSSDTTIDLDPESQVSSHETTSQATRRSSNPFGDTHSIQTAGTEATNVIPIALVTPETQRVVSQSDTSRSASPVRPARSPDLDLDLEHVNVSHDSVRAPANYALSSRSGVSGVSSRNSYMSNASYSSDFLNEAPMIITPNKGAVRQVLGVVKAEMINAPGHSPTSAEGLKPPATTRPVVRSPLAATSFGPGDLSDVASEESVNPFSDRHVSTQATMASSPNGSHTTFSQPSPTIHTVDSSVPDKWTPDSPTLPWSRSGHDSRPSSMSTQAGSVIDIANATRVNIGLSQSGAGTPRTPYRTTMGKLISPPTGGQGTFEEQQQRALAHAQAQAQAQGLEPNRRVSGSSVLSATSTRADSILESFPFVPPSPISNRPARSPPVSPLSQQAFNSSAPSSPLAKQTFTSPSQPPAPSSDVRESDAELPAPPDRRTLGLSTGSQLSTASSGLGSFPFQIDSGNGNLNETTAATPFNGRQRASLDTLAITSDLSSYPLGYDRDGIVPRR